MGRLRFAFVDDDTGAIFHDVQGQMLSAPMQAQLGGLRTANLTVSSAQLLNCNSSPVPIIAGVPSKTIYILGLVQKYNFVSDYVHGDFVLAYSNDPNLTVVPGSVQVIAQLLSTAGGNTIQVGMLNATGNAPPSPFFEPAISIVGAGIVIGNIDVAGVSGGASTLTLSVIYLVF